MSRPRKWTPETICESIRHFVFIQARVPTWRDFDARLAGLPTSSTVRDHYANEAAAIRDAGYEPVIVEKMPARTRAHIWRREKKA